MRLIIQYFLLLMNIFSSSLFYKSTYFQRSLELIFHTGSPYCHRPKLEQRKTDVYNTYKILKSYQAIFVVYTNKTWWNLTKKNNHRHFHLLYFHIKPICCYVHLFLCACQCTWLPPAALWKTTVHRSTFSKSSGH